MSKSLEWRRKFRSPQTLPCCKRKSCLQASIRNRNEGRECKLRAESADNLESRRKSSRETAHSTSAEQHESKLNTQGTPSSIPSSKGCKLLPSDVTDCLQNVHDWEAMEIRILDKDTCTVLRPGAPISQRSDKVIVHSGLYHTDHTIKGVNRSNQNTPRDAPVLKQTVCVEKVHVRNLLHTKREKCGNLGSSRSSEYMPCESTRAAGAYTSDMDNHNYCRYAGSNTGLLSGNQDTWETSSCDSSHDTIQPDTAPAHRLHTPCESGSLHTMKASLQPASGHDGKEMGDDSSSNQSEEYTDDNDEDSEDESSGSGEDESDDDEESEIKEEEVQNSDHSDEESVDSFASDDSYYKKYYKEENNSKKVRNPIGIKADGKQTVPHFENTPVFSQGSPLRSTLEKQPTDNNTYCKNNDPKSRRFNWPNAVRNQTLATSHPIDNSEVIHHNTTQAKDWSATPNETHKALCLNQFYNENVKTPFCIHHAEPELNLNEPSTSQSVSEGKKWDTLGHNRDYFSSTQSISTLTSTTARRAPFVPMPEEEIARYKQIALQILTERKQRALEDKQHVHVQPVGPLVEAQVQTRPVSKKKRSRPSRKYHKSTRQKSKDVKSSEGCQISSCRVSQRAGFWASWRIKNQIEKHRKRFHSTDVSTSKVCRPRNTQACSTARCPQKSPKQSAHKDRNSDIEHAAYFPGFMIAKSGPVKHKSQPLGKTQSKRPSCQVSETLKSKHDSTVADTKISNASSKFQKPASKTHSSLFGNYHLAARKSSANIPFTMRSTQSQYYIKSSTNTPAGTKKASNMSAHPLKDGKTRTHYEHGTKLCQMSGKACAKRQTRNCNTEQAKVCQTFPREKLTEFSSESISTEGKHKMAAQAGDTIATEAGSKSESCSKSTTTAVALNNYNFNVDNVLNTNQNLPKKLGLPLLADWESQILKRGHLSTAAANKQEATSSENVRNSSKPRAFTDLLQNILKSPTAKAAQALGTFLQKPEAQDTADGACDITVDQIISSYQKLFDQLYTMSSKDTGNDNLRSNENLTQLLGSSDQTTDMKTPTDMKQQNTTLAGLKEAPDASQAHFKNAITENNDQGYLASNDEQKCDTNACLREMLPRIAGAVGGNKPSWKGKEITKSTSHAVAQEVSHLSKYNTTQAGIRGRTTSSAGIFRSQARPFGNHDSRSMWRSATPDKRSATEDRFTLKQNENRKSKSSHDSFETIKTTYKQSNHTQRKSAFEVRCSRTASVGVLENSTSLESRTGSYICKNTTTEGPSKLTPASTTRKISFSDSSCGGVKPKINTCLKTSLSCTRQPTAAATSRMNVNGNPSYKCKQAAQLQGLPNKVPNDGKRKCMQQTVTKATHVGVINATGTSLQCMATIQSNPESNSRLTNKFLVHKQCTSSIKTHALVTSAGAGTRMMTTDRIKLESEGQPLIKDMGVVVRDTDANNESRELTARSLQIQEHSNASRTVECSRKSIGVVRTYPAITIFAPQACLNILAQKPSASPQVSTSAAAETTRRLESIASVNSLKPQLCLPMAANSEVLNDRPIEPLGSNKVRKHDEKTIAERKDSMALKLRNAVTQRRLIRPAVKSNSEQWTRRDENCSWKLLRSSTNSMTSEAHKQVHFKSRSAVKRGLSASSSTLTHIPRQREQNASALTRMCKKAAGTEAVAPSCHEHSDDFHKTAEDQASVTNSISSSRPCLIESSHISRMEANKCTPSDNTEMMFVLPRESPSTRYPQSTNVNQHTMIKNINDKKIKPEGVSPPQELACVQNKGRRVDRKSSVSWSKQHLTKSQELKDKHFVTSTALRAIFVTPFSPFHRVDDRHRSDTEAYRRPLAWQKRRCRSAEGFEVKNATSRLLTYGKKKLPPECFPSSAAGKSMKCDTKLRASASNCALTQEDMPCSQVTHSGAKAVSVTETKSIVDLSKTQLDGDAIRNVDNPAHTAVISQCPTMNQSPVIKELKLYEKRNTSSWKPTVSEDESELSEGSSLQAVRKHIVANTCRMIIRESRNLIVSNLHRHTRQDSPQKPTAADGGYDHLLAELHSHDDCLQNVNLITNDAKNCINLAADLDSIETSTVGEGESNNQNPDVNLETWGSTQAVAATSGRDYKSIVPKQHDSSTLLAAQTGDVCSVPLESVSLSKLEISLPNTPVSDFEYGEVMQFDGDIKDISVSSKHSIQDKQYPPYHTEITSLPTHTEIVSSVSDGFPSKDIFQEAVPRKQLLRDNNVVPGVANRQENKQMEFDKQQMRNVTPEIRAINSGGEPVYHAVQPDGHESIAEACLSEYQNIRHHEQNTKSEFQENTNIQNSRGEEPNNENLDHKKVGEGAFNITEHGTSQVAERSRITQNVKDSVEQQYECAGEKISSKEHECDEIWQNNHVQKKVRDIETQQKGPFQNPAYTMAATTDSDKESNYKEFKVRQKDQGNNETTQISRNGDKDVNQRNRQAEREGNDDDQHFKVLDNKSWLAMKLTRESAMESVCAGQQNGDTRQRSRNVDEKSAYVLQWCKNTEQMVGDRRQDNVREKEQKNRTTDEKCIEHCSREIVHKRKDKGPKATDEGEYNKSIDHEDSKNSRATENENIDKWQNSKSVERNKSDVSQTKSSERVSAEAPHQHSNIDQRNTDIRLEDTKIKCVKLQSRSVDFKNSDTREGNRQTLGKHTSAEHNRQVGETSRNGELTRGERSYFGEKTRKPAEVNKDAPLCKGETIWLEEREDGYDVYNEAQQVKDKRYEQRGMSPENRNERHQQRDLYPEKCYIRQELSNADLCGHDRMHQEKDAYLGESGEEYKKSELLLEKRDKRYEQAHTHLVQRDQIHNQKYSNGEKRDTRHGRRDRDLREKDKSHEKAVIDREDINKRRKEENRNIQERCNFEETNEMCEQRDSEHEERDNECANTGAQIQETDSENDETDGEFEDKHNKKDMKLKASRDQEERRHIACARVEYMASQEYSAEEDHESTNHMQESGYADKGWRMRHTGQQDYITLEKGPKTRCQNIEHFASGTRKIFRKSRRLHKESRESGQEIQNQAGEREHNDQAKKDMRHRSNDTKLKALSAIRKSRSAVYESNYSDTECSRGMYQDNKTHTQRVRSQEPKKSNRTQDVLHSQNKKTDKWDINRNIKQTTRETVYRCEHTEQHSKFVVQASQQNVMSESEDDVYLPATREGHKELVEKSRLCERKPKKHVGLSRMPGDQLHKVACVANTTQTEETCLNILNTTKKDVQTRDQHTEMEEVVVLLANRANKTDVGEPENVLRENKIHMRKDQSPSFPEMFISVADKHSSSPEKLRTLNVSPQSSPQSSRPRTHPCKLGDTQIDTRWQILRQIQPPEQALENDKGCLFGDHSEMHINMPLLPMAESTMMLVKTVLSAESLATIRRSKSPSLETKCKSCEAFATISPRKHEVMNSYLYNGRHSGISSTQQRIWNADRELFILTGNEVNDISQHLPALQQKLTEVTYDVNALQTSPLVTVHRGPCVSADYSSFVHAPVTATTRADTGELRILPVFKQKAGHWCRSATDVSTHVAGMFHSSAGGKEHSQFLLNMGTDDTTEVQSQDQPRDGRNSGTMEGSTNLQQKNEPNDGKLKALVQYQQRYGTYDDTMKAHKQQRNGRNDDTTRAQTHHQQGTETNDESTESDNFHQQMNAPKEKDVHMLVVEKQETDVASQQQQLVTNSSCLHGKQGPVVTCRSPPHVQPVCLCIDTCCIVVDIGSAEDNLNLGKQSIVLCEAINRAPACSLQTKHTNIETHQGDRFIPHSVSNRETHCLNDGFRYTMLEISQDSPRGSTDEIVDEPTHLTSHSPPSTRHSLTTNSAQPRRLADTQQTNPVGSPKTFDYCRLQNIQRDLHLKLPYTSVNSFSTSHLQKNTSEVKGLQCYLLDKSKPEIENLSQTQLSSESITTSKSSLQRPNRCNAKFSEHFHCYGYLSRDLPDNAETAHTEENDPLQRLHSDNISASKSQEMIVPSDTMPRNKICAQACQSARTYAESSGCFPRSEQTPCWCCQSISKSQTTTPGVCLHDPHHCCVVQGDRTRHTPAHVSFRDECPLSSRPDDNPAVTMNSPSKNQDENATHENKVEKYEICMGNRTNDAVLENKTAWKYSERIEAKINVIESKPHKDAPCLYCLYEAKVQGEGGAPSSNSCDDVDTEDSNKVKRIKQGYADVTRCHLHKDTVAVRTKEGNLSQQEHATQQSLGDIKHHQSDNFLSHPLPGQEKGMAQSIHIDGKESSLDTAAVWKKVQHSSSKSVQTETSEEPSAAGNKFVDSYTYIGHDQVRAKPIQQSKLSQETSTQTLLKQSDFDDSLELNPSISRDNKIQVTVLRDSCIGTTDTETEGGLHLADAGTSKHETAINDESFSAVQQITSNVGCLKSVCSPLSSMSSKTDGIIRRVLTRSPDVKGNHIQHKAMENLELFVKSTRERHFSACEPRTSPPCKPSSQSPASGQHGMFLKDFVIQAPLQQHASSCTPKPGFLFKDTGPRDAQMHADCSESIVTYSKPGIDNVQMFNSVNRHTSPGTGTKTLQKQMTSTQNWKNSAGLPASTSKRFLSANKLHFLGCWETSCALPAISQINSDKGACQEVTHSTQADDHNLLHIPRWPNALCFISSPRNGDLRQTSMETTRSPTVAVTKHETSRATLAASLDETYYMCGQEGESRGVCSLEDQRRAASNVTRTHGQSVGAALFYKVSGIAVTASNYTETSQSASFTRSCTNPFLQSTTNPFITSAPLLTVPGSQLEPSPLDNLRRPASPLNRKPNPFLDGKGQQLTFDAFKSVEGGPASQPSRKDSPESNACFFKDNTHNTLNVSAIEDFLPPFTAISMNSTEGLHLGFETNTPANYCSPYLKKDGDLMLFSDASRNTDESLQEAEIKGPADKDILTTSACPLTISPNQESSVSAMQDEHWVNMPMEDRDTTHQTDEKSNNKVRRLKVFNKREVRKRRRAGMSSRMNVELWKSTCSFHKKGVFLAGQPRQLAGTANRDELDSENRTSPDSLNNSISDNVTSRCLLLNKRNGVQKTNVSYAIYNSSAETLDDAVLDVSSSHQSCRSGLSEDHSDTTRLGEMPSPSPSRCPAQADDQLANLNILETVTALTSKFMDIFIGLKKNIHKSTGRHSTKHKMPSLQRYRHYYYTPISKNAYPHRKARSGTKNSDCGSQHKIGSCFQERHCQLLLPKNHSQPHYQNAYKLHKYAEKQKASAKKKSFVVKSSNTATSTLSDERVSTPKTSERRTNFHRRKKRRVKMNEEFSISPHVYTEYRRLPVYSSNSQSDKLRAVSSHTNSSIINDTPSNVNQATRSDIKTLVSPSGGQSAVQTESAPDHTLSLQGMLHAPNAQCHDNHHSYPEYIPHAFLPQYPQLYVSVQNGSYYVMPTMPFLSTVVAIVGDGCETYLPEQHNKAPKLVLVDDGVVGEGTKGGNVQADLSAATKIQASCKQTTPLLPPSDKHVRRCQQESDSRGRATRDNMKLPRSEPQHWAQSMSELSNDNLSDIVQLRHADFAHYVDVFPLIPNADIISQGGTKQGGSCEGIDEIMHATEGFDNSWNEKRLYEPCRKYTSKPNPDHYGAAVSVKSTTHSEISSSNLEYDLARYSASGLPSLHGQYYIKDDFSSPPKRRKCDLSSRTPCPAGTSISKQTCRTGRCRNRGSLQMGLWKGCNKKSCKQDLPIPSMTFESKLKGCSKNTTLHLCHEHSRRSCKFVSKMNDGGASITYSYRGQKECFGHILGGASPLSDSLTDCSEKRQCSMETEVPAKAKEEKQYHYDDCEPDTYDELGSLCSEMQDTTSKLFQGDVDLATCKDPTCSCQSKSMALCPTLKTLLGQELEVSQNSTSNAPTQTIHHMKRCASCSHYFGDTLECSKKEAGISRLATENQICQLATKQASQFSMEQRNLLSTWKHYHHPAGYLDDSGLKKLASPVWNISLITLRSAPVTRSCFTQTEQGASGAEAHRPSLVEIRELMSRCIKSRHFRYYVQHIVDQRMRSTLPQKLFYNNDGNRNEKNRGILSQKKNKKRRQLLNDTCVNGNTSPRQKVNQTSLPNFTCQENVTNQDDRILAAAKSMLARKSSSSGPIHVKHGLKDSQNEHGGIRFQWARGVEPCQTGWTTENSKSNDEYVTDSRQLENALLEERSAQLNSSNRSLHVYSKEGDNAVNGIVSRSLPTMQAVGEKSVNGKSIKLWNSAAPADRWQKTNVCLSPLSRINSKSMNHLLDVSPFQEHCLIHSPEKIMTSPEPSIFKDTTDVIAYGKVAAETRYIFENTNLYDQKANSLQPDAFVVGADLTNNTKLEKSTLTDNNTPLTTGLRNQSAYDGRCTCETDQSARTRLASAGCACLATRDVGTQEMSDVSSSSSAKIDYGRLKNIMSAETKLLWKNLTRLENSYDRCKRCRKQYESILGSNKISGECEARTEKLDTACELHSEEFNITRCSNQSTEMIDDCPKEMCTPKNGDDMTNTECPTEQCQENRVTPDTDKYSQQVFNEVNTQTAPETNCTSRVEHTRALYLSSIQASADKCEDHFHRAKTVKDDGFKKPWHVKGKNTAKMIQIFERGNGFFQDSEQQENASNENLDKPECSKKSLEYGNTPSGQQTNIPSKDTASKWAGNIFQIYSKKVNRSTGCDGEAKQNDLEGAMESREGINKIDKEHEIPSNTKCVKLSSNRCDVANQHTFVSTANITDTQHILAMNAPNSETDEWIQKLVNILHEMQQTFPQITATSANSTFTQDQVDQVQEVIHMSDKNPQSLLDGVGEKVEEVYEASLDVICKPDLKGQRMTPVNTPPLDHSTGALEQDHRSVASVPCVLFQTYSKDTRLSLDNRVFHSKKLERYDEYQVNKSDDPVRTETINGIVIPKMTQESIKVDRIRNLDGSQEKHTSFSWLLKSTNLSPCLMSNPQTCSELPSPNECMDENNQASGSLQPTEQLCCEDVHIYDTVVSASDRKQQFCQNTFDQLCYATKHSLDRLSRCSCSERCNHKPRLEQESSTYCGGEGSHTTISSMISIDTVRKVKSCITMTNSHRSPEWADNKHRPHLSQLNASDSESQLQTFQHLCPEQNVTFMNGRQLGQSPGVTTLTQDVFVTSSGKTLPPLDDHATKIRRQTKTFAWSKSARRAVYKCSRNSTLEESDRNSKCGVCFATRDTTSKHGRRLLSESRCPDCDVHESSMDSCTSTVSNQLKTDTLCVYSEMDRRDAQQDSEKIATVFNQGPQWKREYTNGILDESERYEQNTHSSNRNLSSQIQRSNMFQSVGVGSKQSSEEAFCRPSCGTSSVLSDEGPGFGKSYELTMATMNDVMDTSLISNDEDFIDDMDTLVVTGSNCQASSSEPHPVQNTSYSDNADTTDKVAVFHRPQVSTRIPLPCSCPGICECLAENRSDNRSHVPWTRGRKGHGFRRKDALETVTYNIITKRPCRNSKRHKSESPPSVSIKECISNDSKTVNKDISSCLQSSTSAQLDSRNQETIHLQSFDIPIDIYTVPVYRHTSAQKKRKNRTNIPTRTVVISGPVRNMSIAVQRHKRPLDQAAFANRSTTPHNGSPDMAEGSSLTDRTNTDQIAVGGCDRKSMPTWRHAMKRMLPFGKRTTSHEKKIHTHLVT